MSGIQSLFTNPSSKGTQGSEQGNGKSGEYRQGFQVGKMLGQVLKGGQTGGADNNADSCPANNGGQNSNERGGNTPTFFAFKATA